MVLSASQMVALREMRALLVWVLLQLKIISRGEVRPGARQRPLNLLVSTEHVRYVGREV